MAIIAYDIGEVRLLESGVDPTTNGEIRHVNGEIVAFTGDEKRSLTVSPIAAILKAGLGFGTFSQTLVDVTDIGFGDGLVIPVQANAVYAVRFFLRGGSGAATWEVGFTAPSGTTFSWSDVAGTLPINTISDSDAGLADGPYSGQGILKTSTTPGNLQMQVATSSGFSLAHGSWMLAERLS